MEIFGLNQNIIKILLIAILITATLYYLNSSTRENFDVMGYTTYIQKDGLNGDLTTTNRNSGEDMTTFLNRCKALCPGAVCKGFITDYNPNASDPSNSPTTCWIKKCQGCSSPTASLSDNVNRVAYIKN